MANNDLNTNDLYQMIAANKAEADKVAVLAANTPTFQSNMQSGIVGNDATLSSATNNYGDAVAQLFAHDKSMAASNTTPSFAPEGYVSNPMTKESYSANLFADRGAMVANTLKQMETRRSVLGDVVQKAVDAYKYAVQSKQISADAGAKSIDQLSRLLSDAETKRHNQEMEAAAGEAKGITATKIAEAKALATKEIADGANLADIIDTYKDSLTAAQIKEIYNATSSWGKMKESDSEFNRMYQSAKLGASSRDTFAAVPKNMQKDVSENVATTIIANDLLNIIAAKMGNKAPEFWSAIANNDVGKLARLTRPYRNDADLMGMIDSFQAGVRQKIYGSAFTATEAELAKMWLADGSNQANEIWSKLLGQSKMAQKQLRADLKGKGYTEEEIVRNLQQAGYQEITTGGDWE